MDAQSQKQTFACPLYLPTLKDGLQGIKDEFCDASLVAGGKLFKCHKVILVACSKYFYSVFVQDFNERVSEEIRMPPEIDADAMEAILNYFYSGELVLSQENIESVFRATDYMRLDPLLEICIEYMQKTLTPTNCLRRYVVANPVQYYGPVLDNSRAAASSLIVEEEVKTSGTADFLGLTAELISKILRTNNQPEKAECLYMLILKWVGHDEENRRRFMSDLLQMLPVDGISNEFLTSKIKNEELVLRDPRSVVWLLENAMSRVPTISGSQNQTNSLFIADYYSIRKCYLVKVQDPTPLAICDRPEITGFAAVSHKKRIYLVCGRDTEESYQLDDPQESWKKCNFDLKFGRCDAGCVVNGDDLFVVGGWDLRNRSDLKSFTKFNFVSGRKDDLPAMSEERQLPGAAVYANSVYAACGYLLASPSIERFDVREGRWYAAGRYETKIGACSSATIDDFMFACDRLSGKVAIFDFRANRSQEICSLPSSSDEGHCLASVEGDLFGASGGSVFKYEAITGKWNNFCSGLGLSNPIVVPWI